MPIRPPIVQSVIDERRRNPARPRPDMQTWRVPYSALENVLLAAAGLDVVIAHDIVPSCGWIIGGADLGTFLERMYPEDLSG